jgi:hypothetical protein
MSKETIADILGLLGLLLLGMGFYLYSSLGLALIVVGGILVAIGVKGAL